MFKFSKKLFFRYNYNHYLSPSLALNGPENHIKATQLLHNT